ncbi:MAG: NDP-sugar synthase [Chloroflexi bacterium]|nr:NDP-sugar synthase [Chloroflexota bacterium]
MKAIILVGGEATRLRPLTCNTPKIMVPVLNRPFLAHLVGYLKAHNIVDIVLAIGKSPEPIQNYFGDGSKFGVKITYSIENFPMGTAGAVKNAERFLNDSFFVFNGDVFTLIDLSLMMRLHRENKATASLALTPVDDPTVYGAVETDSQCRVKRFIEKPSRDKITTNMINAGIYVLEPDILSYIGSNTFSMFEHDVFPLLLEKGQAIYGYPFRDYWIDIGTPDKYLKLQRDLLQRSELVGVGNKGTKLEGASFIHSSAQIQGPAVIGEGCFIDKNSIIKGPAVLGTRCRVEEGAVIEGAILWQDCKIGKRAKLRNCLVASRCCIGEESEILDGCVLGDDVLIGKGSKLSNGIKIWPGKTIDPGTISF